MPGTLGSLDSLKDVPLRLALDNTGVGLVGCDASGRLTLVSPAVQELFGVGSESVSEEVFVDRFALFRSDGVTPLPIEEVPLHRARRGEFVRDLVVTARTRHQGIVHLKCNAVPLRDDGGADNGAIALIQDVTVEVQAAQRAEALRKRLVDTINHEFRTPLAALLGHVELIHDHHGDLDPELTAWLAAIERSGWKLRDLVLAVDELVSGEDGERPVDCRPRRYA
jgi:PAS domain S-box-containing protein